MSKYRWTVYDLEERLKRLQELKKKEKNPKKLLIIEEDITNLEDGIKNLTGNTTNAPLINRYRKMEHFYHDWDFLAPEITEFSEITESFRFAKELKRSSLSKKDIMDLTHDFYKELGSFFFGNFLKAFRQRRDHIKFENGKVFGVNFGTSYNILTTKESFIRINRDHTVNDLITTIHEYMHATSMRINQEHLMVDNYLFSEVDTLFSEILAHDFIKKVIDADTATICRAIEHDMIAADAFNTSALIKLFELERNRKFKNNRDLRLAALKEPQLAGVDIDAITSNPYANSECFAIGYAIAIELYEMYKDDKEKALDILKRIIQSKSDYPEEMYGKIRRFGIIPNMHIFEFQKDLQKDILTLKRVKIDTEE
jgi:hypothetical protein